MTGEGHGRCSDNGWRRRTDGAIRDEAAEKRRRRNLLTGAGLGLPPVAMPAEASPIVPGTSAPARGAIDGSFEFRWPSRPDPRPPGPERERTRHRRNTGFGALLR